MGQVTETFAAVDVSPANGQSSEVNMSGYQSVVWVADLTALAGGTSPDVTFTWQHSPDGTTWYDIASETALTAVGFRSRMVRENVFNTIRVGWVTTGTPTTATATFHFQYDSD